jgi:hypothetical protein
MVNRNAKKRIKMKEKIIASFLAALMLVTPVAFAATALKEYPAALSTDPTLEETTNSLEAYVVVGTGGTNPSGLASDIAGAIDLALRLTEMSYSKVTIEEGTSTDIDGIVRDGVKICTHASGSHSTQCTVANNTSGQTALPAQIKNTHYTGLKDTSISWRSSTYSIIEQVDISGVYMRHDLEASNINGTNKMVIADSDVKYEYEFRTTMKGTGTPATPNYSYPIGIELMGKAFTIVGVDTDSIMMLTGATCSGVTATNGCTYEDYTVYAPQGGTTFTQLEIQDADGNTVDTLLATGWSSGSSVTKTSDATGLDVTVTTIAALQDGTIVGVDLVVGPTGTTTHDYDATADVESSGTANEAFDEDNPRWGIQYSASSGAVGQVTSGSKIQVVYKPETTEYYEAGEKLELPNDYGELGYEGWNTDSLATITIKPFGPASVYNSTDAQLQDSYLYGLEISSDTSGVLRGGSDYYEKAYLLFNASNSPGPREYPVVVGWYDSVKGKILVADNWRLGGINAAQGLYSGNGAASTSVRYAYAYLNRTSPAADAVREFRYAFVLNNGEKEFYINVSVGNVSSVDWPKRVLNISVGSAYNTPTLNMSFFNRTTWDKNANKFEEQFFMLGSTSGSAEATEIIVTTEASARNAGSKSREVVVDSGLLLQNPASYTGSNAVAFKVPSKALSAELYFGIKGGTTVVAGDTVDKITPITTPIALLDSEVTDTHKAKNIITVGGPCINEITADAMGLDYPTCGADSTIPEDKAIIEAIDDIFTTGKVVVVVAGWEAADTRTAAEVLMKYNTLLTDVDESKVEVTAATTAGITPV